MFRFMGVYREQLWFFSPNLAGCFLAMAALFSLGLFTFLINRKNICLRYGALLPLLTGSISIFILGCTYSRGGYVGLIAGLLCFLLCIRTKWTALWGAIFLLSLLILENGVARVTSAAHISDGSIMNRLLLWRGGMAIVADHFVSGLGLDYGIGGEYVRWFKPLWLDETYNYLLNDFLTLSAGWGLFASGGILCGVAVLFWWGWRCCREQKNPLLGGILAALAAFVACGLFSNMMFEDQLLYTAAGLALIALIWELIFVFTNASRKELKLLWIPLSCVVIFCTVFLGACFWVRSSFPYRYRYLAEEINSLMAEPTGDKISGAVIFASSDRNSLYNNSRNQRLVRSLVEAGFKIYYAEFSGGYDDLEKAKEFLDFAIMDAAPLPVTIFADTTGGKQLFIAAVQSGGSGINRIIIGDIPSEWPFAELSPVEYAKDTTLPITFLTPLADGSRPLYKALKESGIPFSEYPLKPAESTPEAVLNILCE